MDLLYAYIRGIYRLLMRNGELKLSSTKVIGTNASSKVVDEGVGW
jgi:hypothetical protein